MADALLDAAAQQLAAELAVARQDEASVRLVRSQLAAFRREMEKEGQLQRDEVARQVAGSARKAAAIVDQLLQVWGAAKAAPLCVLQEPPLGGVRVCCGAASTGLGQQAGLQLG